MADKIILLNKRDEKELKKLYGRKADFFLPVSFTDTFDDKKRVMSFRKQVELLFVGSLFQPNIEGLKWFVQEVMTRLDKDRFVLKIVGKNLQLLKHELESDNVQVIGTVDTIETYYYSADAVVVPVFYGDGMKVKTAEAMMYGKMILATDEALEGYDISDVEGIFRCNDASEFINKLETVEFSRFYKSVRNLYKNKYSTEIMQKDFRHFLMQFEQETSQC